MKDLKKKAKAYALKNAIAYNGKANSGAVISGLFNEGLKKEELKKYIKEINEIVKKVNSLDLKNQEKEFESIKKFVSEREVRDGLAELPGARKGKVVMRFAPSPSGPMHVGHALTISLIYLYVKKYNGKFYLRIEDTNPDNIYEPAYEMIEKESQWITEGNSEIIIQSERMNLYYKYAEKLIKKGFAYVCDCDNEKFKDLVSRKKACPCRDLSFEDNLERWKKMLDKNGYSQGEVVLRFKTPDSFGGIKHPNPAMRDFPLARINISKHPKQGDKYRVWPLMNLSVCVDDIELGVTHTIRGKDHRDNAERQKMIFEKLGLKNKIPWVGFIGKYKFTDLELSCSKTKKKIESGEFKGWDDSRLPFLASLMKKYKPSAFWKFAENRGLSEADRVIDKKEFFRLLDNFNR